MKDTIWDALLIVGSFCFLVWLLSMALEMVVANSLPASFYDGLVWKL